MKNREIFDMYYYIADGYHEYVTTSNIIKNGDF